MAIKNDRLGRVPPRRRPHYRPTDRMRILQLKAARGWSSSQTAEVFAVTEDTIATWLKRTDEEGDRAVVQAAEPVNKFPDYVGYLVRWLKAMCPAMGKKRIAQVLARAGLHLGSTTVGRMLKQQPDLNEPAEEALTVEESLPVSSDASRAKRPNHIWHVDLTVVPTTAGFWVPWMPFSKLQCWPFCWWVAVVIDQFSRRVTGFALFTKSPTSTDICRFLDRVTKRAGAKPKHIIADKGRQFFCATFKNWCRKRGFQPRYGAVGKHGSIAILERFIRSMKTECTRRILVPLGLDASGMSWAATSPGTTRTAPIRRWMVGPRRTSTGVPQAGAARSSHDHGCRLTATRSDAQDASGWSSSSSKGEGTFRSSNCNGLRRATTEQDASLARSGVEVRLRITN